MSLAIENAPDKTRIMRTFKYCEEAFRKAGISIAFPKDTDPQKTYKWRYLVNFINKLDEFEATDEAAVTIINAVVDYAIKHKQLHKGLALLTNEAILGVCVKNAVAALQQKDDVVVKIGLDAKLAASADLLGKDTMRSLPNVVRWYVQNRISETFLAVSRSAGRAIMKLTPTERALMPKWHDLALIRSKLSKDARLKWKIKSTLGADCRNDF